MKYLLTQAEYDALEPAVHCERLADDLAALSRLVAKLTIGACIHDPHPDRPGEIGGKCDGCGMANFDDPDSVRCPFERRFSK